MGAQREDPSQPGYDPLAWDREGPVHEVEVSPFELSRYPITVCQFERFMAAGGYQEESLWDAEGWAWRSAHQHDSPQNWEKQVRHPNRPVVNLSWYEAGACARWLGGRLPSEAEWEFVARAGGGEDGNYPWGKEGPSDRVCPAARFSHVVPVGCYPQAARQNPWGVHDLAGNVSQWCLDAAGPAKYEASGSGIQKDPVERANRAVRAIRGGSWACTPDWLRLTGRYAPEVDLREDESVGFRVAWPLPSGQRR
jgi:iron(II)-dependent oxidoreductase